MRLLQIVENSPQRLIAVQTPYTASFLLTLQILVALGFCGWFVYTRRWRLAIIPAMAMLVLGVLALMQSTPTYHLEVDRGLRRVVSEGRRGDAVASTFSVEGTDLSAADMRFNRGASTIVLIRKNGSLLYPLGEQQLQNEPNQYVVLTALRDLIANGSGRLQGKP